MRIISTVSRFGPQAPAVAAHYISLSPVIARFVTYKHARRFHTPGETPKRPKSPDTPGVCVAYEVDISYAAVRPHTISDRCLWPDTILRRTFIFLACNLYTSYSNKFRFGSSARGVHRVYIVYVSLCSEQYYILSLKSTMKPVIFNEHEKCVLDILRSYLKCVQMRASTLKAKLTVYLIFTDYSVGNCWILIAFT